MADEPLDDRIWSLPPDFAPWLEGINTQWGYPPGVNSHNVHLLFNVSPFCSLESANKRFESLVNKKPELMARFFTRRLFEEEISEYPGESFVVVSGPGTKVERGPREGEKRAGEIGPVVSERGEGNPLWVIERRWREGRGAEAEVRGHYVVIADRIIAAPALMDVLQSRWTASMLHLSNFYRSASSLPLYSIEKGYSYLHPDAQRKKSKSAATSVRTSRSASPTGIGHRQNNDRNDDLEIGRSFQLTLAYADEYMDENPLTGAPGSFKLSSTSRNVRDKEAKEKEAREKEAREKEAREKERLAAEKAKNEMAENSQRPSGASSPTPTPLKTTGLALEKKSALGKGKSPTSATGEGVKKRRKSKAPITPGPGTVS